MSDLVGNPEDRFSHNKAQIILARYKRKRSCIEIDCLLQHKVDHIIAQTVLASKGSECQIFATVVNVCLYDVFM